jgi:hypothetical protein
MLLKLKILWDRLTIIGDSKEYLNKILVRSNEIYNTVWYNNVYKG